MMTEIEKKICEIHEELFVGRGGRPSIVVRLDRLERQGLPPKIAGGLAVAAVVIGGALMKIWEMFR